jgi:hypothetical protein
MHLPLSSLLLLQLAPTVLSNQIVRYGWRYIFIIFFFFIWILEYYFYWALETNWKLWGKRKLCSKKNAVLTEGSISNQYSLSLKSKAKILHFCSNWAPQLVVVLCYWPPVNFYSCFNIHLIWKFCDPSNSYCLKGLTLGIWCLTPLSTIFELHCSGQLNWWRKLQYFEKTIDLMKVTDKFII